jgi:hypothetical protein
MEQYIPDTPAYASWNPLLVIPDHSIKRRGSQLAYSGVSGMYCSILIAVSQEEDSNLHMQWCQVCTAPAICKLESSACDTVIRMEQYIPDTPAYVSWNPLLLIL